MKISITIAQGDTEASVIIDDRRRISDVISELTRQGYLPSDCKAFMRSAVQERVISTINTFQEERIYSGDKITEIE